MATGLAPIRNGADTNGFCSPVSRRRVGEPDPIFAIRLDATRGIVHAATSGFWLAAEADDYAATLTGFVREARQRFGRAKVLVDRRGAPIQSTEVADRLGRLNAELFVREDRLALVVDSSLAKGQMRRRFVHDGSRAFLSYDAAEAWLAAWR